MKSRWTIILTSLCLLLVSEVSGQFVQDPGDEGVADTVRMDFTLLPDATTNQLLVTMDLYFFNDIQNVTNVTLGFNWVNDNLEMDTAYMPIPIMMTFNYLQFLFRNNEIDSTNAHNDFQFVGARISGDGLDAGLTPTMVATYEFSLSNWSEMDSLVFDSTTVGGTTFVFVDEAGYEYTPYWGGRVVYYDPARPATSNLILSEDTLYFAATQGQAAPAPQSFGLATDNLPLAFDLFETASWLLKSPGTGVTPQDIDVSITMTGLMAGSYFDSIEISSASADNSPQFLYVDLDVAPPPPEIATSPESFFFNAIVDGANPSDQTLVISNAGGTILNWTVANDEGWLTLSPLAGQNSGTVTLSADVTGLVYGDYYDVVRISDPAATNDPVELPVHLSVASDLPLIEVDDQFNWMVVPAEWDYTWYRHFGVRNGGGGVLAFTVSDSSMIVRGLDPVSGTAPDSVEVEFRADYWPDAQFTDTVWVHAPGALNTPLPVVFHQKVAAFPAILELSVDTVVLAVYDCQQGYGNPMPSAPFEITNSGGDDPVFGVVEYESDLFYVTGDVIHSEVLPVSGNVVAKETDLPVGIYYDSIKVTSRWALNKPLYLIVKYSVLGGDQIAQIITEPASLLEIAYQEDTGPQVHEGLAIHNLWGGCMAWEINETVDWLSAATGSGDVPGSSQLLIDPVGYTIGTYSGNLEVVAPSADNSPYSVDISLQVWKLHGDANWNGAVTVQDIALMIAYLFEEGAPPEPTLAVGDADCDGNVTVGDIVLMIECLFVTLEPLCGNPY